VSIALYINAETKTNGVHEYILKFHNYKQEHR
jgi:hypothetical protein